MFSLSGSTGARKGLMKRTSVPPPGSRRMLICARSTMLEQRPGGLVRITLKRAYTGGTIAVDTLFLRRRA
jgi:hypothetical protein